MGEHGTVALSFPWGLLMPGSNRSKPNAYF
jgi:hypothetical protein